MISVDENKVCLDGTGETIIDDWQRATIAVARAINEVADDKALTATAMMEYFVDVMKYYVSSYVKDESSEPDDESVIASAIKKVLKK